VIVHAATAAPRSLLVNRSFPPHNPSVWTFGFKAGRRIVVTAPASLPREEPLKTTSSIDPGPESPA
jgi:hypothetical protein